MVILACRMVIVDPEVLQSGFSVSFYFGPANSRKIGGEFLSEFSQRNCPATFSALFL